MAPGRAPQVDWEKCRACRDFACTAICPNKALMQCVKEYTSEQLLSILRRDFSSWGSGGGVTFSGGDPMMQHDFLIEVLRGCRALGASWFVNFAWSGPLSRRYGGSGFRYTCPL